MNFGVGSVKLLLSLLLLLFAHLFLLIGLSEAQNNTTSTTDPAEVRALNSILQQWDAPAVPLWNISGEPCSGSALNATDSEFESPNNNPAIVCDCTFDNGATCHITKLRVYALNKKGVIPEELVTLQYLTFLKIDQNFFTGPLPSFIGNLSRLMLLSVAHNVFSGSVPRELGNLKELTVLSFGNNNFSGTLPPEIGNLAKLEQLYLNSWGAGGEIPSTYAKLRNMQTLWASDAPFTGKIPDFIGNWTKLKSLRFQGNSFQGPIPSSLSKLASLDSLRISDIYNVSSSLDFVMSLKNLTDLSLRNALITGSIPSGIGELQNLQTFFPPSIRDFYFRTSVIVSLLLMLFTLLQWPVSFQDCTAFKGTSRAIEMLRDILTFMHLMSDFSLKIASAFVFAFADANFSIKCGGKQMRADNIVYEADNSSLSASSYAVTNTEKWGVSNVGFFYERENPAYVLNTLGQVTGTRTPELYQTSRISPGSLRYYGLGLENGPYNVSLLFAETNILDRSTERWESLARRVFDIYIQGTLRWKDFDISKEAGGPNRAIIKNFNATVSENHLEIHLFWAGKGTCCVPKQGDYGPAISALSVVSAFKPSVSGLPPSTAGNKNHTGLIVGIAVPLGILGLIAISIVFYMRRKKDNDDEEVMVSHPMLLSLNFVLFEPAVLVGIDSKPNTFSYAELRSATQDFDPSNKLGEGGYGPVYKGTLSDGRVIAVKQLSIASHQGKNQFVNEIATISAVQHRNLVRLYGCCIEGARRLLVYEYLENKSLDQVLFGDNELHLDWPTRFSICLGTARGLAYLHEESRPRIVHRDVKASNILLDAELCPKISDFGLAKLYDDKKTHISTRVAGTVGYLAPEYAMRGHLTEKADVFSFGVAALEIISGRANSDNSLDMEKIYLLEWAWNLHENNQSLGLVDPTLTEFNDKEALRVIGVALLCTQASPMMRPPMSRVVAMLAGDIEVGKVISKPSYLTDWDFKDITASFLNEDTPTPSSSIKRSNSKEKSERENPVDDHSEGTGALVSPVNVTQLADIIAEGRDGNGLDLIQDPRDPNPIGSV
ncbi:non-specific serine/threonine protein kinase [Citrus sinensis]|nr:non-specific serine/threonine protein kinase [Citrus sinensis]